MPRHRIAGTVAGWIRLLSRGRRSGEPCRFVALRGGPAMGSIKRAAVRALQFGLLLAPTACGGTGGGGDGDRLLRVRVDVLDSTADGLFLRVHLPRATTDRRHEGGMDFVAIEI